MAIYSSFLDLSVPSSPLDTGGGGGDNQTPPLTAGYFAWEFENNLSNTSGNLTWNNINSLPISYPTGISGKALSVDNVNNDGNIICFDIVDPGDSVIIDWSKPFAFSCWLKTSASGSEGVAFQLVKNSLSTNRSLYLAWEWMIYFAGSTRFRYDRNGNMAQYLTSIPEAVDTWRFHYLRYDPANHKKLYFGLNDSEVEVIASIDFHLLTYDSNYRLTLSPMFLDSGDNFALDDLRFWHTTPVTQQDMIGLYILDPV
ncbi:MAG: hypothetical protein QNJ37_04725 [Crocosphaera sp.]|nr:hypothetical protein [Crocosphaera sp.]